MSKKAGWAKVLAITASTFPMLSSAIEIGGKPSNVKDLSEIIVKILALVPPILIAFAVLAILYGIIHYVWNGSEEDTRKEGRYFILWGIVGLFVMISIWGLVNILVNSFGLDATSPF